MFINKIVPIITTLEGGALTMANWEELGITHLAVDLYSLLMKPGLEVLTLIPDLKTYLGWKGELIVSTKKLKVKDGNVDITSIYDGHKFIISWEEIANLLAGWDINESGCPPDNLTNAPAADAVKGLVYVGKSIIDLHDIAEERPFNVIDDVCPCPTCQANLTTKYLDYLLTSTPLLAQRYLIQHNIIQMHLLYR